MISCGKDKPLNEQSDLPNVEAGVLQLLQKMRIGVVQKEIINNRTQEVTLWRDTMACRQAMPERLSVTKEGDRSWTWHIVYVSPEIDMENDDVIVIGPKKYRIMEKLDWSEYGYFQYNVIEDYENTRY